MNRPRVSARDDITPRPRSTSSSISAGSRLRVRRLWRLPEIDFIGASELLISWGQHPDDALPSLALLLVQRPAQIRKRDQPEGIPLSADDTTSKLPPARPHPEMKVHRARRSAGELAGDAIPPPSCLEVDSPAARAVSLRRD